MRAEQREGVADEQQAAIEEGSPRRGLVVDGGYEGLFCFMHELPVGGREDGVAYGKLGGPGFGAHFSDGEGMPVLVAVDVGHHAGELGG